MTKKGLNLFLSDETWGRGEVGYVSTQEELLVSRRITVMAYGKLPQVISLYYLSVTLSLEFLTPGWNKRGA